MSFILHDSCLLFFFFFFFFQAEDGIRDVAVTGVQTCALPISHTSATRWIPSNPSKRTSLDSIAGLDSTSDPSDRRALSERSEERRVGKECRSRWSRYQ